MLPITEAIYGSIWDYYPLMVTYGVWSIDLHEIFARPQEPDT